MSIFVQYFKNNFTEFIVGSYDNKICLLDYRYRKNRNTIDNRMKKYLKTDIVFESTDIIEKAIVQIEEYFEKKRKTFDLPLLFVGSDFQKKVWTALVEVPYSQTSSYLDLAKKIGNEKAVRAVANANGANALSIVVPCHRIIGTNKKLIGYAGGLELKKKLLDLESSNK
ncbi:methylated-DNA--[protein]-cysteine S-methyltransferase [Arcobacter sp. YIC-310]|uniref:methylated-DNA--[protein]-cysteine S-methyltransferase n=1 Tax=Arcobacter sp. YIC-310 TaxID=3376632 RepID=UPI003C15BB7B